MIEDYLCGVTKVRDRNGRIGTVVNRSNDKITWVWLDKNNTSGRLLARRRLLTDKYSDLEIIREFNKIDRRLKF